MSDSVLTPDAAQNVAPDAAVTADTTPAVVEPVADTPVVVEYALVGKALDAVMAGMAEVIGHEEAAMRSEFDRTVGDGVMLGKLMIKHVKPIADAAGLTWNATKLMEAFANPASTLFVDEDKRARFVSTSVLSRALDYARLETSTRTRARFLKVNKPDAKFYLTALKIDAGETLGNRDTTDVEHYKSTGIIRKRVTTPAVVTPNADTTTTTTPAVTTTTPAVVEPAVVESTTPAVVYPWSDVETASDADIAAILATPAVNVAAIPVDKRVAIVRTLIAAIIADERANAPITLDLTV